ncbi:MULTISPECIES: carboxylesterase/lipase family protein [Amycolatopsis]|uniref:Para-nitrobenzyl esterase n=2 Tax=Amycolatopsis TaxID=1813 RepID=A0A1I3WHS8_9PSEU|nr:carboxylesterase family protein [Amycolatopsis sacchari]SFK06992.1 para-nitrobenzyl esterase [Amycolatopsis sacchari]
MTSDRIRVRLSDGTAEGVVAQGVQCFYSLPYAAPLTNGRRFRTPAPVEPWSGIRDATRPGPSAPQNPPPPSEIALGPFAATSGVAGPDYLTLNVFAPVRASAALPVMVFVHGGSFVAGSKDAPVTDGRAFARDGVVCVVINYRLGIEGFLPLDGVPTNLGLRDMIAALRWVARNAHQFGGDPHNVTMFGESGGAYCVAALMTSPLARGLFHRAICQSGHAYASRDEALLRQVSEQTARYLGVAPDRDGFLAVSVERMLEAQAWIMTPEARIDLRDASGTDPSFGLTRFLPVHGDDVLPVPPLDALRQGAGRDVDLLISTNAEEANLFLVPGGLRDTIDRETAVLFLERGLARAREALTAYGFDDPGHKPGHVLARALTDLMFRSMARRTAEVHTGRSWVCEFDWRSPALGGEFGAAHAVELPFVFDTLDAARGAHGVLGMARPQELADSVHGRWIEFARSGRPDWPEFDRADRQVFSLTGGSAAAEPPMPATRFLR